MHCRIRAHHGMCFSFFQGKGYSGAFVENMGKMKERLSQGAQVTLLAETDDVCASCPNNLEGACAFQEKVARYDVAVLALCGLQAGQEIRWEDFAALVRERILAPGRREEICGDCQWSKLCKDNPYAPLSEEELLVELTESGVCHDRGEGEEFDQVLAEMSVKYGL